MNAQRDRNHLRLPVEDAHDSGVAILNESSHRLRGIDNLESIEGRGQRGQDLGLIHGQVDRTKLQQRMSASQQPLGIDIGHAAGGGNVHIAANQDRAHSRARLKRLRLLVVAHRSRAHHGDDSRRGKLSREKLNRLFERIR